MPHVATQWQPKEWEPRNDNTSQARKMASGKVVIYPPKQQSNSSPRERKAGMRTVPSMGKLLSLDAQGFDSGLTHHAQNRSSDMLTPLSPIDTVFELESPRLPYSSNSSPNSSVVAELEDTSPPILPVPNVNCPRRTARASSSLQFQSSKTSPHAILKVLGEAIVAIEADNHKLRERVAAAEATEKALKEQNDKLQRAVDYYTQHRPRTAPSPTPRSPPRPHINTPLSSFNAAMDLENPMPRFQSSSLSNEWLPPPSYDLAPCFLAPPSGFSSPRPTRRRLPTLTPPCSGSHIANISSPTPSSTLGRHLSFPLPPLPYDQPVPPISLAEAQRRSKALPPLGPMSPSAIPGKVEIGFESTKDSDWGDPGLVKKKRSFRGLFRGKRKG